MKLRARQVYQRRHGPPSGPLREGSTLDDSPEGLAGRRPVAAAPAVQGQRCRWLGRTGLACLGLVLVGLWVLGPPTRAGAAPPTSAVVPPVHGGAVGAVSPPGSTPVQVSSRPVEAARERLTAAEGWRLVYAGGAGRKPIGRADELSALALREASTLGVTLGVFHGPISGTCERHPVDPDGIVTCDLLVWCSSGGQNPIPEQHGHRVRVDSTGELHHIVIMLNDRNEEKILALESARGTVAWYGRP